MKQNKIYVYSGGCSSNHLDGQRMLNYFRKNDYEIVSSPKDADVIVVNTCAFEKQSEGRSIQLIKNLKDSNRQAKVVVTGCLPAINKKRMLETHNGEYFIPKDDENWKKLDDIFKPKKISILKIEEPQKVEKSRYTIDWTIIEKYHAFKSRGKNQKENQGLKYLTGYDENAETIRIAKGCLGNCSYCAIKKARGNLKSESIENLVEGFEKGFERGCKSFKIWAEDVGDYGKDINRNLSELLDKILIKKGDYKLEILSTNPKSFIELYNKLLPSLKDKRIDSFTISVQSGSKKILKKMNRCFNLESFVETLEDLHKKAPHLTIRAHYMVGFPGETWNDFFHTINLAFKTKMYKSLIFKFDAKPNTLAEKMDNQISESVKDTRLHILKFICKIGSIKYYDGESY